MDVWENENESRKAIGDEFMKGEEECMALNKWTKSFTSQHHPSVIHFFFIILTKKKCNIKLIIIIKKN